MNQENLLSKLNVLLEKQDDEEKSATISALISLALHENEAEYSLEIIYRAISNSGIAPLLDSLTMIPLLLPSKHAGAQNIISLLGECCSAKEVVIAVQEAVERLQMSLSTESDEEEEEDVQSYAVMLGILISLYSSAIPRLKLRKKTASETISPLLADLESTVRLVPRYTLSDVGREIITLVSVAVQNILAWAKNYGSDEDKCHAILFSLLETSITACIVFVNSSLAQTAFRNRYPRMVMRQTAHPAKEASDRTMQDATDASIALGYELDIISSRPNLASLALLSHNPTALPTSLSWFMSFLPTLMTCIQTNVALDEAMAILFIQLTSITDLPPEIFGPLASVLPSLASVHPDPPTRFLTFRLLAILLKLSPPPIRFEILRDLTSDSEFPQMRTAAIGLVKEAVLDGLDPSSTMVPNDFVSHRFIETFSPIIFRPNPPELLSTNVSSEEFKSSSEPPRLGESLALLYVLLLRDKNNRTGIRDNNAILAIKRNLLDPIRLLLSSESSAHVELDHGNIALASLYMNLERVDSTLAELDVCSP